MMQTAQRSTYQSANSEEIETPKASTKRKRNEADEALEKLIGNYGGSPWLVPAKQYSSGMMRLHQEIQDFYNYISPTSEELQVRNNVIDRIKTIVIGIWPYALVYPFGSYATGLYLPISDIDLVVFGKWDALPLHTLGNTKKLLLANGVANPETLLVLETAAVPTIKMVDRTTGIKVDISFNQMNGIETVEYISNFKRIYSNLPQIVLVVKQFLVNRDLNEVFTGGLSSYSLILLVISFFQRHPRPEITQPNADLGVLLIEFFELYGRNFNYRKTKIQVKNGGRYAPKTGHNPSQLCIEDPLNQANNVASNSFWALQVKTAFEFAFVTLILAISPNSNADNTSILERIIRVTDDVIDHRQWIQRKSPLSSESSVHDRLIPSSLI